MFAIRLFTAIAVLIAASTQWMIAVSAAQAATVSEERLSIPYNALVSACTGESVALSGEVLMLSRTVVDERGAIHTSFTLIPQQVRGVGAETGAQYQAVGGERTHYSADADIAPLTYTNTLMLTVVSQDGSPNLQLRSTFHATINPDREATALIDNAAATCIGQAG